MCIISHESISYCYYYHTTGIARGKRVRVKAPTHATESRNHPFRANESREEICAREESSRAKRKAKSARFDEETRSIFATKKAGTRGTRTRERAEKSARERKDGERGGDVESEDAKCGIGEVRDAG
jgi:hypothetical protein